MDWIWRVQNDDSDTDIAGLWRYLTGGDAWHRKRFSEAWADTSGQETWSQAFDRGGAAGWEGFKEGATFGWHKAPEWARKTEGFNISRGIGMATTSLELGLSGVGLGAGTFEAGVGTTLYTGVTSAGYGGRISMGLVEAGGGLAVYGSATSESPEAPNPQIALQTAAVPVAVGMFGHVMSGGSTASGRPIDNKGRVLGPSGKPMIYVKTFSTEKRAKDAARQAGMGAPVKDSPHRYGGPHYHPVDDEGERIKNEAHYEFPE
jgi:hypothetical protein